MRLLLAVALLSVSCGVSSTCDASNCSGCCSDRGTCVTGTSVSECGAQGAACVACSAGAVCLAGACRPKCQCDGCCDSGGRCLSLPVADPRYADSAVPYSANVCPPEPGENQGYCVACASSCVALSPRPSNIPLAPQVVPYRCARQGVP